MLPRIIVPPTPWQYCSSHSYPITCEIGHITGNDATLDLPMHLSIMTNNIVDMTTSNRYNALTSFDLADDFEEEVEDDWSHLDRIFSNN